TSYEEIRNFFKSGYDCYVGHNIRRWDIPNLERVIGIEIPENIVDTLAISWYLSPERFIHSLESYGEELGVSKPVIEDWVHLDLKDYLHRCETDVEINTRLWIKQLGYLNTLYDPK